MIDPAQLLTDLQRLLKRLEDDIRVRVQESSSIDARLREQYDTAKAASRTGQAYEVWRDDYVTQVAVAWILGCVFVRFMEDNSLIEAACLSGLGDRLQFARDQYTLYFQRNPSHSDREYLQHVFAEVAKLRSMRELLDGDHNPLTKLGPTGDGAHELLEFWQKIDPTTGTLIHDFTDPGLSTRFLGDLYQDLSESARERYALLQTPEFVEDFILDRTLTPAIEEFGYATVKMIDPACGSGHFLLGGFRRLMELRLRHQPGTNVRVHVQAVLDQVFGIDVNPFAVAIARFRLLIAATQLCAIQKLADIPALKVNVAAGDSLLHGPSPKGLVGVQRALEEDPLQHYYDTEDAHEVRQFLSQSYHVIVGNPPYITVKDKALNQAYRNRFRSCHMKYSLVAPFVERIFDLALRSSDLPEQSGFVGMITANSFMRREFGKKLVENVLPNVELTHIVDTSRAHIPDYGTPTVILFARNRMPVSSSVRAVMGIRAELERPVDAANGRVWVAILRQIDDPGSQSEYVSVADLNRNDLARHPWSLGGGGAAQLRVELEKRAARRLKSVADSIGFMTIPGDDDVFLAEDAGVWTRLGVSLEEVRPLVPGENVRDWSFAGALAALFPYDDSGAFVGAPSAEKHFWKFRSLLQKAPYFGKTKSERGLDWREYAIVIRSKFRTPSSITYSNVATHNHFVLSRGGVIFNSHSPVIKLPANRTEDDHLSLLGLLNSSTGCFWMKQVFHNKGGGGIGGGLATEEWEQFYELDGTKLGSFPVLDSPQSVYAHELDIVGQRNWDRYRSAYREGATGSVSRAVEELRSIHATLGRLRSLQEELDWEAYHLYGLVEANLTAGSDVPDLQGGERAFEIAMAREQGTDGGETTWFDRHGAKPIAHLPPHWQERYQGIVNKRIEAIQTNPQVGLIEQPTFKRRWNAPDLQEEITRLLRTSLLKRMESREAWADLRLQSCNSLADRLRLDPEFVKAAQWLRGRPDFDWTALVTELVEAESVPFLSVLRHTESGIRKRAVWERTWALQREEDRIDAEVRADGSIPETVKPEVSKRRKAETVGAIAVPPKYDPKDFRKSGHWSLRGKLDVPKERFVSFPHCERDVDPSPVIAWAGWNHLQLAQAIAAYYERVKNQEGWTPQRRMPLLAGILELLPWLKQWHNDIHPEFHERMGDFFEQFVQDEARAMEVTVDQIRAWTPPAQNGQGRRRRNSR